MFPKTVKFKNRRFTPYEEQTERELARIFRRPPRTFFYDDPFYPYCVPEPLVNFDIVSKYNKGQQ